MATLIAAPRTPSPRVRIRSLSFDSPSSRIDTTPIDDGPLSKSTGSLITLSSYDAIKAAAQEAIRSVRMLLPLNTKMSDDSILSDASSPASSASSSPSSAGGGVELSTPPPPPSRRQRPRPHPLQSAQHTSREKEVVPGPTSPFLYQDTSFAMYSPWLVCVVLDMYDVRGLDWMAIADPIERVWGIQTSSADVLGILSDNGRVPNRRWWD